MSGGIVWRGSREPASGVPPGSCTDHVLARGWGDYDFDRAIWLPVSPEPVRLIATSGLTLPGRIFRRRANSLTIAIVVPCSLSQSELDGLIVEYANPCGRVRFTGDMSTTAGQDCVRLNVDNPQLVSVVQQRAYVRVTVQLPVSIETDGGSLPTMTVDVSGGGMLLADHGRLIRGETVPFELELPGARPIAGTARTVRFDAEARPALEFVSIPMADRWRLVRFTLDLQRNRSRSTHLEIPAAP